MNSTRYRYRGAWEIEERLEAPRLLARVAAQEAARKAISPAYRDDETRLDLQILQESA